MAYARVALKFAEFSDGDLDTLADTVIAEMTTNAAIFPSPPVTIVNFQADKDDFADKLAAAAVGGQADTADKNASRQVIIGVLRQLASYVEMVANGDEATLLKSGFQARSTERSSVPLEKPSEMTVTNDGDGALAASCKPIQNCSMFEGRAKADGSPDWMESVFGNSQQVRFASLTPGVLYTVQIRGLGGSTGTSDWSDPVQHRSL